MRLAAEVRSRTRCARRRSRSRSSRSSSEGIQSAGTRSRRHNSASTRASTRSVLHASGAIPFTRRASATSTCQPAERSRSRTHTAPLIISTHAFTSVPSRRTSLASPSSSADVNPSALIAPPTDFAHHAALRYAQSIPTYSVTRALLSVSDCVSKRPLSRAPGRPSFMTFSRQGPVSGWRMSGCGAVGGGGDLRAGARGGRRCRAGVVGAVGAQDAQLAALAERVEGLEQRLKRDSRDSSLPPSRDPPWLGKRGRSRGTGRKQGAQPGHLGHGRSLFPIERVTEIVDHWPASCGCGHVFGEDEGEPRGAPARHQVAELPPLAVEISEHRLQRVCCPNCGRTVRAELPAGVPRACFGPKLEAAIAVLTVRDRLSRRQIIELMEELFGCPIAVGTVDAILTRTAETLAPVYNELLERTRAASALNIDETGWYLSGEPRTLWGAFGKQTAV